MNNESNDWFVQLMSEIFSQSDIHPDHIEEIILNSINNALPNDSKILLDDLKSTSGEMLEEQRLLRQEFETRLLRRWSKAINSLEMLTVISLESAQSLYEDYHTKALERNDMVFRALLRTHARACQVTYEILCLLRGGFADGAFARWRTLYELSVISFFIMEHGNQIAERYLEYAGIETYYEMLEYNKHYSRLGFEPLTADERKDTIQVRDKLIAKYGLEFGGFYGWTATVLPEKKRSFRGIEENVRLSHWRPFYKLACHNVHPGSKGDSSRLGLSDTNDDLLLCGASNYGLADPGQNTSISLTQVTTCLLTVAPSYERLVTLKAMKLLSDETCDLFVQIQEQLDLEIME